VLIVGAGLSGIGAAWHLQDKLPGKSVLILEGREAIGGTWDLFRYPGIRSDSDMYTLGYAFRPWTAAKAIADGPSILRYVRDTAREADIERRIRFRHHVKRASFSTEHALWTVEAERTDTGERVRFTCRWLHMCTGYYDYARGHDPDFPDREDFGGPIVHPQFWPEDLDHCGKRVVVIGSGATAVTIVPEMAKRATHVTMLQRSPTYMVSLPSEDPIARLVRKLLPARKAYDLIRWKNVLLQMFFFRLARKNPAKAKEKIIDGVRALLPEGYDVATHFTPRYNPWDQRLCLVPDADMFDAIKAGRASVVTGDIERFTAGGIRLKSGEELPADIIVTATGLKIQLLSDVAFSVDGEPRNLSAALSYRGMMFSDVPNLSYTFGYTNASWTLKADLTAGYLCRLLAHMDAHGYGVAMPRRDPEVEEVPFLDFTSGYVQRALHILPKQGSTHPWKVHQNYIKDIRSLRRGPIEDGVMEFSRAGADAERVPA
jgi:cation diffusion facilitator CzcD-associated flavoprotein CzcO